MPFDVIVLLVAVFLGAGLQVGVGIGFSIVVAPLMMVLLGTATAVPILLLLNTIVSLIASERRIWLAEKRMITIAVAGCLVGTVAGLMVYPFLSERTVLLLTATLLLIGVLTTLMPLKTKISTSGFAAISGLAGLATVWAATPGPLMVFGMMAIGRPARDVRRLVQPVALVAYGVAFALHGLSDWSKIANAPWLFSFVTLAIVGSIAGRFIGPKLPQQLITHSIRVVSILACIALFRRAYMVG